MAVPMSDHVCQFFDTDESRAESVAAFLAEGLRAGDHVIAVPRAAHWTSIAVQLSALGISVDDELAQGNLVVRDAVSTLEKISPRGRLSPFAFNEVMGAAIKRVSGRRLRGWGEMVDVLAERGELDEALELEELWNRVAEMVPLTLMCAYSAAHFVAVSTHRALRDICLAHTDVHRKPQDTLANWVLTTAHHVGRSSSLH
jgi:MEDS: MEthanogen/methylotroph, DcmR Sensory domain